MDALRHRAIRTRTRSSTSRARRLISRVDACSESGVAIAEFALVLPLMLVLLLGMVDFGKAFNYWNTTQHLANETARWVAVNKTPVTGQIVNVAAKEQATTQELQNAVSVCVRFPSGSTGQVGQPVEVVVSAPYTWLAFLTQEIPGLGPTTIKARAVMRLEQPYRGDGTDAYQTSASCP